MSSISTETTEKLGSRLKRKTWQTLKCVNYNETKTWFMVLVHKRADLYQNRSLSQQAITYSKLTIEALEQRREICSKLTIKTPKRRHWLCFDVFIVNFEHISHLCSRVFIVNFEQVNAGWVGSQSRFLSFHCCCKIIWRLADIETKLTNRRIN